MLNVIDLEPMHPGWGRVWQSGEVAAIIHHQDVPGPRLIVSMVGPLMDPWADMHLATMVEDWPDSEGEYQTLPDEALLAMVDAVIAMLKRDVNVIIHCLEGKSRSSYLDVAIHMAVMGLDYDAALALVKKQHPIAQPNPGFEAQLRRMTSVLHDD